MSTIQPFFTASRVRLTQSLNSLNSSSTKIFQASREITVTLVNSQTHAPEELIPTVNGMESLTPSPEIFSLFMQSIQKAKKTQNEVTVEFEDSPELDSKTWSNASLSLISD